MINNAIFVIAISQDYKRPEFQILCVEHVV